MENLILFFYILDLLDFRLHFRLSIIIELVVLQHFPWFYGISSLRGLIESIREPLSLVFMVSLVALQYFHRFH